MKTKREHIFYAFYNHTGMARHLEKMAARGWMLDHINTNGSWRYHAIEPARVHFAVAYFPTASDYDAAPDADLQHFLDLCHAAGWELVARTFQMMIFCSHAETPVPLETDPAIQVANIHEAMWSSYMWGKIIVLGLGGWLVLDFLNDLTNSPVQVLSWYLPFLLLALGLILVVHQGWELLSYYRWHKQAERIAKEENRFLPVSGTRAGDVVLWLALAVLLAAYAILENWRLALVMCIFTAALDVARRIGFGARDAMKRFGAGRFLNRIVTFLVIFVLTFAVRGVERSNLDWILGGNGHAQTEYTYNDHTYTAYSDELPFTLKNLLPEADNSHYSNRLYQRSTPFVTILSGSQYLRQDYSSGENQPQEFYYHIFRSGLEMILEDAAMWREYYVEYNFLRTSPKDAHKIDPTPYDAITAWKNNSSYLFRYEDCVIQICFGRYPTAEEIQKCLTTLRSL